MSSRRTSSTLAAASVLHFLHVPKAGGTAIRAALAGRHGTMRLELHDHDATRRSIPATDHCFFVLRDPVTRFTSAFYSRQRRGRPRYDFAWTPEEARLFERFTTPSALAEALASTGDEQAAAERAMTSVPHFRPMHHWTGPAAELSSDRSRVLAILFQETLATDFSTLTARLGVRATLPDDPIEAHKNPETVDRSMSDLAVSSLRSWYARDYDLLAAARELTARA